MHMLTNTPVTATIKPEIQRKFRCSMTQTYSGGKTPMLTRSLETGARKTFFSIIPVPLPIQLSDHLVFTKF
jgi:hypothetical protein